MAGVCFVFDMRGVDGDATSPFLGRLVDLAVVGEQGTSLLGQNFGDSGSQCCFSMIDVA
jgi:hypothetical protein